MGIKNSPTYFCCFLKCYLKQVLCCSSVRHYISNLSDFIDGNVSASPVKTALQQNALQCMS